MSIIIDGNSGISTAGGTPIVNTNTNPSSLGTVTSITSIGNVSVTGTGYGIAYPDASLQTTVGYTGFRNRIINGNMVIDQRYSGAATANTISGYTVDRWNVQQTTTGKLIAQQNAASVTPPPGFTNYLGVTSQSAYAMTTSDSYTIYQWIEGYNIIDLAYGTANARSIAVSFWVYISLTGVYSWRLVGANNGGGYYSYVSTFTVSVANTWQFYSFTVPGSTAGQWFTNNGNGLALQITLANNTSSYITSSLNQWISGNFQVANTQTGNIVGTNGATFYLTGVQIEAGKTATPFEYRQFGTELALCQRYCCNVSVGFGVATSATAVQLSMQYPVTMRAGPSTVTAPQGTARVTDMIATDFTTAAPAPAINNGDQNGTRITLNGFSGMTSGRATMMLQSGASAGPVQFSAEL
jgi:hypothetical protein